MYRLSFWMVLLTVMLSGCGEPRLPSPFHASEVSGPVAGANFSLRDPSGQVRTLADFRGKVVALFFGYTHCPDVCPTTLADMARLTAQLGDQADKLQVVFVTLDPERDTPEMLAQYVPAFHPGFVGLYGDAQQTAQVAKDFAVVYQRRPAGQDYTLDHSAGTYLIDPQGRVRLLAPYGQRTDWMVEDIRLLLALARAGGG